MLIAQSLRVEDAGFTSWHLQLNGVHEASDVKYLSPRPWYGDWLPIRVDNTDLDWSVKQFDNCMWQPRWRDDWLFQAPAHWRSRPSTFPVRMSAAILRSALCRRWSCKNSRCAFGSKLSTEGVKLSSPILPKTEKMNWQLPWAQKWASGSVDYSYNLICIASLNSGTTTVSHGPPTPGQSICGSTEHWVQPRISRKVTLSPKVGQSSLARTSNLCWMSTPMDSLVGWATSIFGNTSLAIATSRSLLFASMMKRRGIS